MRRYVGEGALVGLGVLLVVAIGARFVPAQYESTSVVEASGGVPPAGERPDGALQKQIQQLADAPDQMVLLSSALRGEGEELATAERAIHGATTVTARSKTQFAVSFRASSPDRAQKGNTALAGALIKTFGGSGAEARDEGAQAKLEAATKALADFVSAHPKDLTGPATAAPASTAANDAAIANLRKERTTIEATLEKAKEAESSPVARENPYSDPPSGEKVDTAQLQRRLVEIKNAIVGFQKDSAQKAEAAKAGGAGGDKTSDVEWQRRVQAVADAQKAVAAASVAAAAAPPLRLKLVEPASLPGGPLQPIRLIATIVGIVLGCAAAALWMFARAVVRRTRRFRGGPGSRRFGSSTTAGTAPIPIPADGPAAAFAGSPPLPALAAGPQYGTQPSPAPAAPPPRGPDPVAIPKAPPVPKFSASQTQIGIVDPAHFTAAQNGGQQREPSAPAERTVGNSSGPGVRVEQLRTVSLNAPGAQQRQPGAPSGLPSPPGLTGGGAQSPVPPPPPRTRSYPPPAPAARPSGGPGAADPHPLDGWRPQNNLGTAPAPAEGSPNTQRLGTQASEAGRGSQPARDGTGGKDPVAMYRPDTTYSFVDRSSRVPRRRSDQPGGASVPPAPGGAGASAVPSPPAAQPVAPAEPVAPPPPVAATTTAVVVPAEPQPEARSPSDRPPGGRRSQDSIPGVQVQTVTAEGHEVHAAQVSPAPAVPPIGMTRPGWPIADMPEQRALARTNEPRSPGIEVRSVSPSWRPEPDLEPKKAAPELFALRDQLLELGRKACFVVGVAADPGASGAKSLIAGRLATMLSTEGRSRILLVDSDFDFPSVHELTGIDMPPPGGFSQQIRTRIRSKEQKPWTVVRCAPTLDILAEGSLRSPGVLFSQEFSIAITELRRSYDVIVVDAPIVGTGSEHKPIDAVTDGLIVVGRPGTELSETLDRTARRFKPKALVAAVHAEAAASPPSVPRPQAKPAKAAKAR